LVDDINSYLAERNVNPKAYKWTAKGEAIVEKNRRARAPLEKVVVSKRRDATLSIGKQCDWVKIKSDWPDD
jgi:hypothetical protein